MMFTKSKTAKNKEPKEIKEISEELTSQTKKIIMMITVFISLAVLMLCYSRGISGNDFWWHIKVGEWILDNGYVPSHDIFSWYGMSENISWTPHEWLSDVIFYLVYSAAGQAGIFILSLLSAAIMVLLIGIRLKEKLFCNMPVTLCYICFFTVLTSMFFYGRPHLFSYFLMFALLYILYKFRDNENYKGIFALPLIAALWSNLHGGSSNMAYIIPIVFLVTNLKQFSCARLEGRKFTKKQIIITCAMIIGAAAAIFVNPVGKDVFLYPYKSMSDSFMLDDISEWASPDAKQISQILCFFVPIFLIGHGMIFSEKKLNFTDTAYFLMFLYLFFRSSRFIMLFCIAAVFFAADYIADIKSRNIKKKSEKAAVGLLCVLFAGLSFYGAGKMVILNDSDSLVSTALDQKMVDYVKNDPSERLFNDYNYGETLIYNNVEVFFDARADLYAQKNIMRDGVGLLYLQQTSKNSTEKYIDVEKMIDKYDFDGFLISKSRPLYVYLLNADGYELVYETSDAGYFKRS